MLRWLCLLLVVLPVAKAFATPSESFRDGAHFSVRATGGTWQALPAGGSIDSTSFVEVPKPPATFDSSLDFIQLFPQFGLSQTLTLGFADASQPDSFQYTVLAPGLVGRTVDVNVGGTVVPVTVTAFSGRVDMFHDPSAPFDAPDPLTGVLRTVLMGVDPVTSAYNGVFVIDGTTPGGTIKLEIGAFLQAVGGGPALPTSVAISNDANNSFGFYRTDGAGMVTGWQGLPRLPAGWRFVGFGDFRRDGHDDALVQNTTTGRFGYYDTIYQIPGGFIVTWRNLSIGNLAFTAFACADVNFDGYADIVMRNASNRVSAYLNSAGNSSSSWVNGPQVGAGWTPVGMVDINRDNRPDLVVQNGNRLGAYLLNGLTVVGWRTLPSIPAGWEFRGFGEFGGSPYNDLLLEQTSTRKLGAYLLNGGTVIAGWRNFITKPAGWTVRGMLRSY